MRKMQKEKLDQLCGVNMPGHFYKSIQREAKKLGLTLSDYITAILINEMRYGAVKKDIEFRISKGNILWAIYPTSKEVYQSTPEESELMKRAYAATQEERI